jgi:AcrR family transcriptional regulator
MVHRAVKPDPRQRLLHTAIEYVAEHGVHDLSLRELAAAIGTSHRMLIYHFGSKEGLLVAIVEEVEARQRHFFATFAADLDVAPDVAGRAVWRQVSDPALDRNVRLFFALYGQALQRRPGTEGFLDRIVDAWLEPLIEYGVRRGVPRATAAADARLSVAVVRGLLLDLVATGDRAAVDAAYERYLEVFRMVSPT